MKRTGQIIRVILCSIVMSAATLATAQADHRPPHAIPPGTPISAATRNRVLKQFGTLPLSFEANQGQAESEVRFLSRSDGYKLFLTSNALVLSVPGAPETDPGQNQTAFGNQPGNLKLEFVGAPSSAHIVGAEPLPGKINYFIGNDPKHWHTGVPTFARVTYEDIYPGVDLTFYGNKQHLEYDFVVGAGADPRGIRMKIDGAKGRADSNGDLLVQVGSAELRLGAPNAYQEEGGKRRPVKARWLNDGRGTIRFALGDYDQARTLIIDPTLTLVYSTYLGGSGIDAATSVALDPSGDAYIAGYTNSTNFPQGNIPGYQDTYQGVNGSHNAFIAELDPTGSTLIYSTYLGGNNGDAVNGITVDSSGRVYVVGTTFSSNFPNPAAFQPACAGGCKDGDVFVAELNPSGPTQVSQLVFSSFLGGTGYDEGNAIALDSQGNVWVTGWTTSSGTNATGFPVTDNAHQSTFGGGSADAFLSEISPPAGDFGSQLVYSTYLGGDQEDVGTGLAVDGSGNIDVVGLTTTGSTDTVPFPLLKPIQSTCGGCATGLSSAFVTQFSSSGGINFSTYLGGTNYPNGISTVDACGVATEGSGITPGAADAACGVAVDSTGNIYVAGFTTSSNFPVVNSFQGTFHSNCGTACSGQGDGFVTKLSATGNSITYSTYLGGSGDDRVQAIAVDTAGNAFVAGFTYSTDFPLANKDYDFQSACAACSTGGSDAFVTEFDSAGNALVFSSYLGGSASAAGETQEGEGIAVGSQDQATVAGLTLSSSFPTQSGDFQTTLGGGASDAFVSAFPAAANCSITSTGSALTINATVTCYGDFFTSGNSLAFLGISWGDHTPDSGSGSGCAPCQVTPGKAVFSAPHTYTAPGTYSVVPSASTSDTVGNSIITTGFSVGVTVPYVSVTTLTLPPGQVKSAYTTSLAAAGGLTPPAYSWLLSSGSLPPGLNLSSAGVIAGTPSTVGSSSFTVQVTDSEGEVALQALSITVTKVSGTLQISPPNFPSQTTLTAYPTTTLEATGGTPPYTWTISSGILPDGLTLKGAVISGTPILAGNFGFTIQVTDSASNTATLASSIVINPPANAPTCQPPSIQGNSGNPPNPLSVTASSNCTETGGTTIATVAIDWGDGTQPLSGTGSSVTGSHIYAAAGSYPVIETATDSNGLGGTAAETVNVVALPPSTSTVTPGQSETQSNAVTAPPGVPTLQVTFSCTSVNGPSGMQSFQSNTYGLTCAISPASPTLTQSPTNVTVTVTTSSASGMLLPVMRNRNGLYWAVLLPLLPAIVFLGIGASTGRGNKNRKKKIRRYAVTTLLTILACGLLACGGQGTTSSILSNGSTPTPAGSYSVTVTGTDSSGANNSTITVGFNVGG